MLRVHLFTGMLATLIAGMGIIGIFIGLEINKNLNWQEGVLLLLLISILFFAIGLYIAWRLAKWFTSRMHLV
jgi:Kef-type K+ transport system membrane component KefB